MITSDVWLLLQAKGLGWDCRSLAPRVLRAKPTQVPSLRVTPKCSLSPFAPHAQQDQNWRPQT